MSAPRVEKLYGGRVATSVTDRVGRTWTIVCELAIVGYKWRIYVHFEEIDPMALEQLYPGGTAWGWTGDDAGNELALLVGIMAAKGSQREAKP